MQNTRKQRSRSNKTMRAGAPNMSAHYTKFVMDNLKQLDKAANALSPLFSGTNPDFIKKAGLAPAQKKFVKLFDGLEDIEKMLRANKYYDHYANSK